MTRRYRQRRFIYPAGRGLSRISAGAALTLAGLNPRQLQFVLGILADLVAGKLLGDMFEQVHSQPALLPGALDQTETQSKEIFRGKAFFFLERFEYRIGRIPAKVGKELHGGMVLVTRHRVGMELELRRGKVKLVLGLEFWKVLERRQKPDGLFVFLCLDQLAALFRQLLVNECRVRL